MTPLFHEIRILTALGLKSIPDRPGLSVATVFSVALVVTVLLSFLAMANGFQKTLQGTGSEDVAIILRSGAEAELNSSLTAEQARIIREAPGLRIKDRKKMVSAELYVIVDAIKKASNTPANIPFRGLQSMGPSLRKEARLSEGRMFRPGTNEIVVGKSLLSEFSGFELGKSVKLGSAIWTVVGVFEAPGTVFESELWADAGVVQSLFNRRGSFQTVRLKLQSADQIERVRAYIDRDPRLKFDVKSEKEFYAEQSSRTSDLIFYLGWPLSIAMAIGALAGAANTMYNAVSARAREIVTLRTIGFHAKAAFFATVAESIFLSALGGLLGAVFAFFFFDGLTTSTLGGNFTQVVFSFQLTPELIVKALLMAVGIGLLGGVLPARRAARMSLVNASSADV